MANSATDDLFKTLRAKGLRRRAARVLSEAAGAGAAAGGRSEAAARSLLADLRKVADDLEARIPGRGSSASSSSSTSASRSEAAQKGAQTRKRDAQKRS